MPVLCTNCRYYQQPHPIFHDREASVVRCRRPEATVPAAPEVALVAGEPSGGSYQELCAAMRLPMEACGPDGNLFEPTKA